jgi:hypothetical protein
MTWAHFLADLQEFAESLSGSEECVGTAEDLARDHAKFRSSWSSTRSMRTGNSGLRIPTPREQGLHPRLCTVGEAWINFEFELGDADCVPRVADLQVRVSGLLELEQGWAEVEDHWRVDTDRYTQTAPREPHPAFHFQRGGHAQDRFASHNTFVPGRSLPPAPQEDWRGLMQSPAPRIPIPPMCPILMLDFVIAQHNGPVWQRLRERSSYFRVVARAQQRLWTPFFDSLAVHTFRRRWFGFIAG